MPKNNWNFLTVFGIICCIVFFAAIRFFQHDLFYDPLISFFKGEYQNNSLPKMDSLKLLGSVSFRFILNSIVSLVLIYLIFKDYNLLKFASLLFGITFVVLIVFFSILIYSKTENYFLLFNIRRFLIQPLLVILFVPAFYYQKLLNNK